ncbi:MAG TPA: hypothetical protein VK402_01745 [Blastococcus sp.]|nr:hypothetical protein [Blastococcus sp.]
MPSMLVKLDQAHLEELVGRAESGTVATFTGDAVTQLRADAQGAVITGPQLDAFVLRCIGTAVELQAHQERGGALLAEYPDGTVRELSLDLGHDGTTMPRSTMVTRATTRRRRGRRVSSAVEP